MSWLLAFDVNRDDYRLEWMARLVESDARIGADRGVV
jgi:hypothetical protein